MAGKYARLTGEMVRRGITLRTVQIIGPDGQFIRVQTPVEAEQPVTACRTCGAVSVDNS